jgi:hypothetical protein
MLRADMLGGLHSDLPRGSEAAGSSVGPSALFENGRAEALDQPQSLIERTAPGVAGRMVVIAAPHRDRAEERLHGERALARTLLQGARRFLVGEELRVAQELREQTARVAVQGGPQLFLQPLRKSAQTLLACQPRPR